MDSPVIAFDKMTLVASATPAHIPEEPYTHTEGHTGCIHGAIHRAKNGARLEESKSGSHGAGAGAKRSKLVPE